MANCLDCGKILDRKATKRCKSCHVAFMLSKNTYIFSKEAKIKMSLSHKGQVAWNKGLVGGVKMEKNPNRICPDCGGKKGYQSSVCIGCVGKYRSGEKSPNWRGGAKNSLAERVKFVETIRLEVLKRDNYKCQLCGSNNHLQVDHIQSWAEYAELRFDINNCRTLCNSCHYKITFGKEKPEEMIWGGNINRIRSVKS